MLLIIILITITIIIMVVKVELLFNPKRLYNSHLCAVFVNQMPSFTTGIRIDYSYYYYYDYYH